MRNTIAIVVIIFGCITAAEVGVLIAMNERLNDLDAVAQATLKVASSQSEINGSLIESISVINDTIGHSK